jgi:hypothetical protein
MSKARGLADLGSVTTRLDEVGNTDGALSNRNLIINGAMQVAQRGTSKTGVTTSGYHTVDRFSYTEGGTGGSGDLTMEQSTDAPDGFSYSAKYTVTTANTLSGGENICFRQRLEAGDCQALKFGTSGNKFTISFWVKASLTGLYSLQCYGSDQSRSALSSYTVNVANTWEYKTLTFNVDPTTAIAKGTGTGLAVVWMLDSGPDDIQSAFDWSAVLAFSAVTGQVNFMATSGATWQITGVQLEVGDTATPFEHRSYGQELALCQRFCQRFGNGENNVLLGIAHTYGGGISYGVLKYHNTMRTLPSATFSTNAAATWRLRYGANLNASNVAGATGIGVDQFGKDQCRFYIGTGTAADNNGWVRGQTDASYLILDAEL